MSHYELTAVYRTAAGVSVTIRQTETGHATECEGCGWAEKSSDVTRPGEIAARLTNPLTTMRAHANTHALGCAEVPHRQWPGAQETGGW